MAEHWDSVQSLQRLQIQKILRLAAMLMWQKKKYNGKKINLAISQKLAPKF